MLLKLVQGVSLQKKKWARHRATEYMIDKGKLWKVAVGHCTKAHLRVECVTREEAMELA